MSIGRICQREVDLAEASESVRDAARRLRHRGVGSLVVVDAERRPVGIVTDRDLVLRVLAEGKDIDETTVREVMTTEVESVEDATPIETALALMRSGTVRRLPVVDRDGRLTGLVSVDDILLLLVEEFWEIGRLLEKETPRAAGM
jgi:CBS domain-containing protein